MNIHWDKIDTVLLDMDGTLLDLKFDNYFWHEFIPLRFAIKNRIDIEVAKKYLEPLFKKKEKSLDWYCLDYWTKILDIDVLSLKVEVSELISVLPYVIEFLEKLNNCPLNVLMVTNAHRDSLKIKFTKTNIDIYFDHIISSHDYGVPKEDYLFWYRLINEYEIDIKKTILIDDSLDVLESARNFGFENLIHLSNPDSSLPPKSSPLFTNINDFRELINFF